MRTSPSPVMRIRLQKGRTLCKRGKVWYLESCSGGVQERRSLGTGDLQEATRRAAEGPDASQEPPSVRKAKATSYTLADALGDYDEWYTKNRRESGRRRALPVLENFATYVGEDFETRAVTRDHVQRWVDRRVDGRAGITVRNDFARVRAFLRWIWSRKEAADPNSCRAIEKPKDDDVTREAPSVRTVQAVLTRLRGHPWIGDFCRVLAETGLRPSELLGARGVDLRGKLLDITPWAGRELKSKWSKRRIELNDAASGILKARHDLLFEKTLPLFANEVGGVYQANSALHAFRKALEGEDGKVPPELDMTLYDFRHFFCSEHAAPGPQHMDLEALAAYIGHSPKSRETLVRWYTDQNALRRGAPKSVIAPGGSAEASG